MIFDLLSLLPTQEEALVQELKLAALDGIEAEWRAEHDRASGGGASGYGGSYASWMSDGTSLIGEDCRIE